MIKGLRQPGVPLKLFLKSYFMLSLLPRGPLLVIFINDDEKWMLLFAKVVFHKDAAVK